MGVAFSGEMSLQPLLGTAGTVQDPSDDHVTVPAA